MAEPRAWKRLRQCSFLIRQFRNWPEIQRCLDTGRRPASWDMRAGYRLYSTDNPAGLVKEIFVRGSYAPAGFEISPGEVVVDIGAHIGMFSLYAVSRGAALVHAYEPSPENFQHLKRNVEENRLTQVVPHWAAVTDSNDTVTLMLAGEAGSDEHALAALVAEERAASLEERNAIPSVWVSGERGDTVEVPSLTLASVFEQVGRDEIDLLKLDCEGAEGVILTSATEAELRRVKRIVMEFHDHLSPVPHPDLVRLLNQAGFTTKVKPHRSPALGYLFAQRSR